MARALILTFLIMIANTLRAQPAKVDKVVDACARTQNFNGAVLIANKGKVDYLKYTGIANRHYDIPYSEQTVFHIFSLTKTFTAVLIMQLCEQGRLSLDSVIAAYYPEYQGEAARKATIRNLLTYSSGRANKDISSPELIHQAYDNTIWNLDSFIATFLSEPLTDTPGARFNYNNGDFILLGKIIEKVWNKPYEQVLNEQILKPLHMRHTGFLHHNDIIPGIDEGYAEADTPGQGFYMPTNTYTDNLYSAGAMYATPQDLLLFDQALFHHKLLKKQRSIPCSRHIRNWAT